MWPSPLCKDLSSLKLAARDPWTGWSMGRRHFKWLFSAAANAKFCSLWPPARSPSSGLCYASAFDFFPPGCVVLSGGRLRGNHHRRSIGGIHSREEIPRQRRRSPAGHELTKKCSHFNSLYTGETVFRAGFIPLLLYI